MNPLEAVATFANHLQTKIREAGMNREEYRDHCNTEEEDALLKQEAEGYWFGIEDDDQGGFYDD